MRLLIVLALAALIGYLFYNSRHPQLPWSTNYDQAFQLAKTKKLPLLMNFTGSDWCSWCTRLDREVFSTPQFKEYAAEHLVLLKLDFPRDKAQNDSEKRQNKLLLDHYGVKGFPTIIILDSEGNYLDKMGYQSGGPDSYIRDLKQITHQ